MDPMDAIVYLCFCASGHLGTWAPGRALITSGTGALGFPGYVGSCASGLSGIKALGHLVTRATWYLDSWALGHLGSRSSGLSVIWALGYLGSRSSGLSADIGRSKIIDLRS
jgi:hypothetical protein